MTVNIETFGIPILPGSAGTARPCPDILTEAELIDYPRIHEVSKAKDYHNVIDNLERFHDLPRIHICGKPLYPREAIQEWVRDNTNRGK